jgi:hypothetical protein
VVLPLNHAQLTTARREVSRRERWMIGGVLAVVAALAIALVISLAAAGPTSAHGCIYVTIPADTGAQEINQCGENARSTCSSALDPHAFPAQSSRVVAAECRKAGLPVGRP